MKNPGTYLLQSLLLCVVTGCSTPYYGYSEDDWNSFSESEKKEIAAEYQLIVDIKKKQRHQAIIDSRTKSVVDLGAGGAKY